MMLFASFASAFSFRFHLFNTKRITGGIKTIDGAYTIHTFTGNDTFSTNVQYLIVGESGVVIIKYLTSQPYQRDHYLIIVQESAKRQIQ